MTGYLLDTNTVSYLVKEHPAVVQHVMAVSMDSLSISTINEAELLFGLARQPPSSRLQKTLAEFLQRVVVLPWDRAAAQRYGRLRADLERSGKPLGDLDMLIAAHALSENRTLVTADKAFVGVPDLVVEDWKTSS